MPPKLRPREPGPLLPVVRSESSGSPRGDAAPGAALVRTRGADAVLDSDDVARGVDEPFGGRA